MTNLYLATFLYGRQVTDRDGKTVKQTAAYVLAETFEKALNKVARQFNNEPIRGIELVNWFNEIPVVE